MRHYIQFSNFRDASGFMKCLDASSLLSRPEATSFDVATNRLSICDPTAAEIAIAKSWDGQRVIFRYFCGFHTKERMDKWMSKNAHRSDLFRWQKVDDKVATVCSYVFLGNLKAAMGYVGLIEGHNFIGGVSWIGEDTRTNEQLLAEFPVI